MAVCWQESGDMIRITIQGLQFNISRYCEQDDILQFLKSNFRKTVVEGKHLHMHEI